MRFLFTAQDQSLKEEIVSTRGNQRAAETGHLTEEAGAGEGWADGAGAERGRDGLVRKEGWRPVLIGRFLMAPETASSGDAAAKKFFLGVDSCSRSFLSHSEELRRGAWETPSGETPSPPLLSTHEGAQPCTLPRVTCSAESVKSIHKRDITGFVACKPQR